MDDPMLIQAVASPPPGPWAVGVSGGADSVALLLLLAARSDLALTVVHLNHQTRGHASEDDAKFVADLAARLRLDCVIERRDQIEKQLDSLPANLSSRYRAARLKLFRNVLTQKRLGGVILAHHADDQAETILHRLLRGAGEQGAAGLAGMRPRAIVGDLAILRPLLKIRRDTLRDFLQSRGQAWREDASNQSDKYLRNRLRKILQARPGLTPALLELGEACAALGDWKRQSAPLLAEEFAAAELAKLPRALGRESARQWLIAAGAEPRLLSHAALDRLIDMSRDAASPRTGEFPGQIKVIRRRGRMSRKK
jgi:tRNA(Ile)-lysidine synthase